MDPSLELRLEHAMLDFYRMYAEATGSYQEEPDAVVFRSSVDFLVYSGIACPRLNADNVLERIEHLKQRVEDRPYHWFIGPTARPESLVTTLQGLGGQVIAELNGMACLVSDLASPPSPPPGVSLHRADTDDLVVEYARLYPLLFSAPTDGWVEGVVEAELRVFHSPNDPMVRYVARRDGVPVGAGGIMKRGDEAVLETLLTLPELRGQGIGQALTTHALRESGARSSLLWAGPGADKLYSRMGFHYVCVAHVVALA